MTKAMTKDFILRLGRCLRLRTFKLKASNVTDLEGIEKHVKKFSVNPHHPSPHQNHFSLDARPSSAIDTLNLSRLSAP